VRDLWVAEMEVADKDEFDHNKFRYFVIENPTKLSGDWHELPSLDVQTLLQAQRIKRIISGDLKSRLVTNPEFDGPEESFLRAQLARIAHATTLMPTGIYKTDEADPFVVVEMEGEEKVNKSTADLATLDNWVWARPGILPSGLLKAAEVEEAEGDDAENQAAQTREKTMDRLIPLTQCDDGNWKISLEGLTDSHKIKVKTAEEIKIEYLN